MIARFTRAACLLAIVCWSLHAEQGMLVFVFGPSSQDAARQGAHAAASTARHWMQTGGGVVQLRRAGSPDAERLDANANGKDLERIFGDAATAAREADPPSFLISLEAAVQSAARESGARVVVAVTNTPPFSSEGERSLEHLTEVCRSGAVRVLVLDIAENTKRPPNAALNALASKSGGMWVSKGSQLEANVLVLAASATESAETVAAVEPAKPETQTAATAPGTIPKFEIPVFIRFMRTSGTGSLTEAITDREADFGTTMTVSDAGGSPMGVGGSEMAYAANDANHPLQGLVTVESPLNALKFDIDDNTATYQAHARLTAIVRDANGKEVWTGRREANIHGPVRKLDARRQGSLYFMRAVGLVGHAPFTLEAKVEDLLGGTVGEIRTPLRTSRNAPGLVASDASVVRPFKSADKFEADQVWTYEGDVLSPVLNPVYKADEPIDLKIYLRLYPDTHSDPPRMSMEILHDGRVVTRMPLAFKNGMANSARDGASSKIGGRAQGIVGGEAKEFPYLIDLKGAKFAAGNYQGVISIRQGKNVITRVVPFRVVGDESTQRVALARGLAAGGAQVEGEEAEVVLPSIESVTVDSSGLKMRQEEQKRIWEEAAAGAMGYLDHLPNFRCTQETHRFSAPVKTPDQLKEADSFKDEIVYEDGKEHYQTIEINGVKPDTDTVQKQGIHARNEFGSMLRGLFDPDTAARYKWVGRAMTLGALCQVFEVEVAKAKSNFVLHTGGRREPAGYTGRVYIDEEAGMIRRITIDGNGLPPDFGLQSPSLSIDYGMVKIGAEDHLLPLRSALQLRHHKEFIRNETVFRNYRKFEAESEIKFQEN